MLLESTSEGLEADVAVDFFVLTGVDDAITPELRLLEVVASDFVLVLLLLDSDVFLLGGFLVICSLLILLSIV